MTNKQTKLRVGCEACACAPLNPLNTPHCAHPALCNDAARSVPVLTSQRHCPVSHHDRPPKESAFRCRFQFLSELEPATVQGLHGGERSHHCYERLPRVTGRAGRSSSNGKECKRCPNGSVSNTERNACKACKLNEKLDVARKVCTPCSPGDEVASNRSACVPCGVGKQSTKKSPRCTKCVAGKEPASSHIGCPDCQGGSASPDGVKCVKCYGGKQPNQARTACVPCPGQY